MKKKNMAGWLFTAFAIGSISLFYFYPMIRAFLLSLQSGMGANLEYVGVNNYLRLFNDPTFKTSLINTLFYLVIQVPIMIVLALFFFSTP